MLVYLSSIMVCSLTAPPAVSWCVPHQEECVARPSTLSNGQTAHTCSQTEKFDFVQTGREYDCVILSLDAQRVTELFSIARVADRLIGGFGLYV